MPRYHVDTNAETGLVTSRPFTQEEEAAFDAMNAPANNPLTAKQFRLGLVRNKISLSTVQAAINNLPTQLLRDEAQIYWEYSNEFDWNHPTTQTLLTSVGFNENTAAAMWLTAKGYID